MQASGLNTATPILVISGRADIDPERFTHDYKVQGFLPKPFSHQHLLDQVAKALGGETQPHRGRTMQTGLPTIEEVAKFHGHLCPGLALGYQAARLALGWLQGNRSEDEEVVAVVENSACGIDAIQYVLGTTAGKGNFFIRDYGKHVYSVANRQTGLGLRMAAKPKGRWRREGESKDEAARRLLAAPPEDLFDIREEAVALPKPAEILESLTCASCGEGTMETKVRHYHGDVLCIPCFQEKSAQAPD